jgi:hypothetical protein
MSELELASILGVKKWVWVGGCGVGPETRVGPKTNFLKIGKFSKSAQIAELRKIKSAF